MRFCSMGGQNRSQDTIRHLENEIHFQQRRRGGTGNCDHTEYTKLTSEGHLEHEFGRGIQSEIPMSTSAEVAIPAFFAAFRWFAGSADLLDFRWQR